MGNGFAAMLAGISQSYGEASLKDLQRKQDEAFTLKKAQIQALYDKSSELFKAGNQAGGELFLKAALDAMQPQTGGKGKGRQKAEAGQGGIHPVLAVTRVLGALTGRRRDNIPPGGDMGTTGGTSNEALARAYGQAARTPEEEEAAMGKVRTQEAVSTQQAMMPGKIKESQATYNIQQYGTADLTPADKAQIIQGIQSTVDAISNPTAKQQAQAEIKPLLDRGQLADAQQIAQRYLERDASRQEITADRPQRVVTLKGPKGEPQVWTIDAQGNPQKFIGEKPESEGWIKTQDLYGNEYIVPKPAARVAPRTQPPGGVSPIPTGPPPRSLPKAAPPATGGKLAKPPMRSTGMPAGAVSIGRRPIPPQTINLLAKKRDAIQNTLSLIQDINLHKNALPKNMWTALKEAAAQERHGVMGVIGRILAQRLSPEQKRVVADIQNLQEHVNTIREPLGATGFRGAEPYDNLLGQVVTVLQDPEIAIGAMQNTETLLKKLLDDTNKIMRGEYAEAAGAGATGGDPTSPPPLPTNQPSVPPSPW
jgi:hypothetical protein